MVCRLCKSASRKILPARIFIIRWRFTLLAALTRFISIDLLRIKVSHQTPIRNRSYVLMVNKFVKEKNYESSH